MPTIMIKHDVVNLGKPSAANTWRVVEAGFREVFRAFNLLRAVISYVLEQSAEVKTAIVILTNVQFLACPAL
jgi:hypothetical protein